MAYILSCCSTADLSREHFESRDIHYICFHFFLDGKAYKDDLGESIPFDKFYAAMANGAEHPHQPDKYRMNLLPTSLPSLKRARTFCTFPFQAAFPALATAQRLPQRS